MTSTSGNILFLILIAVALFAALSYAATYSNRNSSSSSNTESFLIASSEIVQFGASLESAITRMRIQNKCAATDISFERPPFDGSDADYVNGASPADFSCHVFHPNGGRTVAVTVPQNANDGRDWAYIETRVLGIGADQTACAPSCHELVLVLGGLTQGVCQNINRKLIGNTTIPVQDDGTNYENKKYDGTFNAGADIDGGAAGVPSMCTEDAGGVYYYYRVLLER